MTKLWNRTFVRQTIALLFVLSLAITVMACNGNGDDDDKTPRATLADHVVDALDNLDEDDDPDELEDLLIKEGVLPANAEAITEEFEDKLEDAEDAGLTREVFIEKVSDLLGDLDDD